MATARSERMRTNTPNVVIPIPETTETTCSLAKKDTGTCQRKIGILKCEELEVGKQTVTREQKMREAQEPRGFS
jgi:hypothetical protein